MEQGYVVLDCETRTIKHEHAKDKQALKFMSKTIDWKSIRGRDGRLHFYNDKPVRGVYEHSEGTEILPESLPSYRLAAAPGKRGSVLQTLVAR
jgi:hypothetical protein